MFTNIEKEKINKPIGIFDSGIGGLTVLRQLKAILPNENYLYFGDTLNLPYGAKNKSELIKLVSQIMNFFIEKDVKAVVMGCNTTSALTYDYIKQEYNIPIYPIIQNVSMSLDVTNISNIAIFATEATIRSQKYKQSLLLRNHKLNIMEIACPEWVNIVENNLINTDIAFLSVEKYLKKIKDFNPDKIILGCTHYPYLLDILTKFYDESFFVDPAKLFALFIQKDLQNKFLLNVSNNLSSSCEFFVSSAPNEFIEKGQMLFDLLSYKVNLINLNKKFSLSNCG